MKHVFGIFGAFIGFLVTGVFIWDGTGDKYSYMFIGVAIGLIIGYFIFGLFAAYKQEGYRLMKKIRKLNPLRGKNINDVIDIVGGYSSKKPAIITDRNNEKGFFYTFAEGAYELELLVGSDDIIIGVIREMHHGKKVQ